MTYRSGRVERTAVVPPIAAEVVALQRSSALCQERAFGQQQVEMVWAPAFA